MITPRTTRLIRVGDVQAFREALVALAIEGTPRETRDRLVIVPTRAAAALLVRSIEDRLLPSGGAAVLPELATSAELVRRLASRLPETPPVLGDAEREVLLAVSCRTVRDGGIEPPFRLRPGLVAEMLRFYDALQAHQRDVDTFERLALGMLEPGAASDRGAERLVRQTRFLVAAFREFERRCAEAGWDEHALRRALIATPVERPFRHVVVAVGDRAFDRAGLRLAEWDLLARLPGLERLDVVMTDGCLAGAQHERIHRLLPGIEEVREDAPPPAGGAPVLQVPPGGALVHRLRDRDEEVAAFARRVKHGVRTGAIRALDRVAIVVQQRLPYVYLARELFRSAGVPCQMFDALPLAAEPYAAALDLVLAAVASGFARGPLVELLRSAHFRFPGLSGRDAAALDRALRESGYLGEIEALETLVARWRESAGGTAAVHTRLARTVRAGEAACALARELAPLREPRSAAEHLSVLLAFLTRYERPVSQDDPVRERHLRARGAVLGTLDALRQAHERFDSAPVAFDDVAAMARRWMEGQTFAPRSGDRGVHLIDADSARFGAFDDVQLAGLVEGEWPEPAARSIFYSGALLRELGWPPESECIEGARAMFRDLLRLPSLRLTVSSFALEGDAPVSPSPLLDELDEAGLDAVEIAPPRLRIFEDEALGIGPVDLSALPPPAAAWGEYRCSRAAEGAVFRGCTSGHQPARWSVSALERYQDCPFKYFAADVLRLEDAPDDGQALSPRARGRLVHAVFHEFLARWDAERGGPLTPECIDEARALLAEVAEEQLALLPPADAALERVRLFGSAISVGIVDAMLGVEASRPTPVEERWLEHELCGTFSLGDPDRRIALTGVADRVDLLPGRRLRVIDYKTGAAPSTKRALQVAVYALCAQERLTERDGAAWAVDEAAYVAFGAKRVQAPVVKAGGAGAADVLAAARVRVFEAVDAIRRGEFPVRPYDEMMCRSCAYPAVCRKDYVVEG